MSAPVPGPRSGLADAGARGADAEAMLAGFDDAPLQARIDMLSALDARLRADLDAPEAP